MTNATTNNNKQQLPQYESISIHETNTEANETRVLIGDAPRQPVSFTKAWVLATTAILVIAVALLVATSSSSSSADNADSNVPLWGSSHTRPCTFEECFASNCNHDVAPFTCLWHNGGPHGGCSPGPWTPESCSDSCDLTDCDAYEIPDTVPECSDEPCTVEWCAGGQVCPSDVPYQCVDGAARFGCSTDPLQWTLKSSASTCSSCCDTTSCE